jgi:succinyl-diaminopimelate desuccinylase
MFHKKQAGSLHHKGVWGASSPPTIPTSPLLILRPGDDTLNTLEKSADRQRRRISVREYTALQPIIEEHFRTVQNVLNELRPDIVENLSRLLTFSTVSGCSDIEDQRQFANELSQGFSFHALARQMGFTTRNHQGNVFVIEQPGGPEVIGIPLHIDVVPSGEGWTYPAFGGMVENDTIYGRGTQDNKGPIIEMLYALYALRRLGRRFRRTVRLIIASQEETGDWSDVAGYLEKEPAPDFCIVADAEFPIVSAEKGMADIAISIDWREPFEQIGNLRFFRFEGGERPNIVPNRAEITWDVVNTQSSQVAVAIRNCLEEYLRAHPETDAFPVRIDRDPETGERRMHVTFLGKSAHSSTPENGRNAIVHALGFLCNVPDLPDLLGSFAKFLYDLCKDHYGEGAGVAANHDFVGPTTISLGLISIDEHRATACINVRPTHGVRCEDLLVAIRRKVQGWALGKKIDTHTEFRGNYHEPLYIDPKEHAELIGALRDAFEHVTGDKAMLKSKGGTTFAKAFPKSVAFGPIYDKQDKDLMHQADENITVAALMRNTAIYSLALMQLALDFQSPPPIPKGLGIGP